jgi:hypothetical protein
MTGLHDDYHANHALEAAHARRIKKAQDTADDAEKRWKRRILPLLANEDPMETDFGGCYE